MPVYSMTGYGSATFDSVEIAAEVGSQPASPGVTVEVRSVNGRFLDVTLKTPDDARGLESALRELVTARLKRGKVELRLTIQRDSDATWPSPSPEQLRQLAQLEHSVQSVMSGAAALSVNEVLHWCRQSTPVARVDAVVIRAASAALDALSDSRRREGERLVDALRANAASVRAWAAQAQPLVASVVQRQQQRFLERWNDALLLAGATQDVAREAAEERALSEAAAYALRIDVAEELTRLNAHLDELEALLAKGGELGKRLDFLMQELHREANTLGAKSQALELTNLSMSMKVAIEQMREQVQNLE